MSDHILKLTVIDGGRTKRKAEIGHITYPLKNLEIGDGTEQQLFKMDLEKVRSGFCKVGGGISIEVALQTFLTEYYK